MPQYGSYLFSFSVRVIWPGWGDIERLAGLPRPVYSASDCIGSQPARKRGLFELRS